MASRHLAHDQRRYIEPQVRLVWVLLAMCAMVVAFAYCTGAPRHHGPVFATEVK